MKKILFVLLCLSIAYSQAIAQLKKWEKIEKVDKLRFNYNPEGYLDEIKLQSLKEPRLVFIDRGDAPVYTDPYAMGKRPTKSMWTPCYVLETKNNFSKLVVADPATLGKPKSILAPFMSAKYRFKDIKNISYVGWVANEHLLYFDHSFISSVNNKSCKYLSGMSTIKSLAHDKNSVNNDSMVLFKDPFLKEHSNLKLPLENIVYVYKYNKEHTSALVAGISQITVPIDSSKFVGGWVSLDYLVPIGQNLAYKRNTDNIEDIVLKNDSIGINSYDKYGEYLYDKADNAKFTKNVSAKNIEVPIYIWNREQSKLINVKGDYCYGRDVYRMMRENKNLNIHIIFNDKDRELLKVLLNTMQNIWFTISSNPQMRYSFTTCSIDNGGANILPRETSFRTWQENLQKLQKGNKEQAVRYNSFDMSDCIDLALNQQNKNESSFEENIFIIAGSNDKLHIDNNTLSNMAEKSAGVLFVQLHNEFSADYQDYLLQAKKYLDHIGKAYNDFIENYIVDHKLMVDDNSMLSIDNTPDNVYIYDSPKNSLFCGGLIFPSVNQSVSVGALGIAVDTILANTFIRSSRLLESLVGYQENIGILYCQTSNALNTVYDIEHDINSPELKSIARSSIYDAYYVDAKAKDVADLQPREGYLLSKQELLNLVNSYHSLLPLFTDSIQNKQRRIVEKLYKKQIKGVNNEFGRKILRKRSAVADLFYYKTGLPVDDELLPSRIIKKISRESKNTDFDSFYNELRTTVDTLELKYLNNELETTIIGKNKIYYYLPAELLL